MIRLEGGKANDMVCVARNGRRADAGSGRGENIYMTFTVGGGGGPKKAD